MTEAEWGALIDTAREQYEAQSSAPDMVQWCLNNAEDLIEAAEFYRDKVDHLEVTLPADMIRVAVDELVGLAMDESPRIQHAAALALARMFEAAYGSWRRDIAERLQRLEVNAGVETPARYRGQVRRACAGSGVAAGGTS